MKKVFFILAILFANVLFAQNVDPNEVEPDFKVGYLGYKYKGNNEVAVHNYDEEILDSPMPWNLEIPQTVDNNEITYTVTSIGTGAFSGCHKLQSVVIPNTVTSIDYNAFTTCNNLQSVNIPSSVTSIGDNAFLACGILNAVNIAEPSSVTSIGSSAFSGCNSLENITLPNSVTTIGDNAFQNCAILKTVTIGSGLTAIADHMFENCMQLETVNFNGNSLTSIGSHSFNNCQALTTIILPNSVTIIEDRAFRSCELLQEVTLPIGLETIGEEAFIDCHVLTSIAIPNNVKSIEKGAFVRCVALPSIDIPNNSHFTILNKDVFYGCSTITSVDIPNNVTHIDNRAFQECSSLTTITIPENVTTIGNDAFYACTSLTSVTIPSTVTSIGDNAFANCEDLTTVVSLADPAPECGQYAFYYYPNILTVPFNAQGYTPDWGSANWQKIYHKINEGERDTLRNTFEITNENKREVINDGVLVIEQGGELVNQTATNVGGIVEVEAINRANNWSYIGAPFNDYELGTILPQVNNGQLDDVSVSTFNYATGIWNTNWETFETVIPTGEGFAAWNFGATPVVFTTYGDIWNYETQQAGSYDFEINPDFSLFNEDSKTIAYTDNNTTDNVNWLVVSNPYTFKLDIAKIKQQNTTLQGGGVYKYNGESFVLAETGEIDVTGGFFVNTTTITLAKSQRYIPTQAKASVEREYVRLAMLEGEREIEVLFAQNDQANENYDIFDANKLFSPIEIAEPYFVVNNIALVKEEVNTLPYYATMNVRSFGSKEVTFKANYIPEGLAVSIIDGEETIDLGEGVEYTTNIIAGENADRFKVLIKKSLSIEEAEELQVNIYNNNRHINIETMENDLQVEVYNALGQKVLSTKDRNFTLNQVSAGAYLIKAFNNKASKTQKIVVK